MRLLVHPITAPNVQRRAGSILATNELQIHTWTVRARISLTIVHNISERVCVPSKMPSPIFLYTFSKIMTVIRAALWQAPQAPDAGFYLTFAKCDRFAFSYSHFGLLYTSVYWTSVRLYRIRYNRIIIII